MAIVKLVLLIVGVVAQQYGATTPNVRPPAEQLREQHGGEHLVSSSVTFAKVRARHFPFFFSLPEPAR